MTTLYRPVLIETAEQAEALPEGTVAVLEEFAPEVFVKDGYSWLGTHGPGGFTNVSAVGLTALVPIEAEEETRPDTSAIRPWGETTPDPLPEQTRYVTPWEQAGGPLQ